MRVGSFGEYLPTYPVTSQPALSSCDVFSYSVLYDLLSMLTGFDYDYV